MAQQNVDINVNLTGAEATAKGLNYIGAAAESFGNKVASKMTAMFSAVAIGAMVFDKIGEAMSKNMATAKQIGALSTKFHIDPKEVHSLMLAANDAGVQVRSLLMGMKQLGQYASKAIVDPDKADILKQMGFDMSKLNELASKPAAHLAEISVGLMNIGDENQRNKVGVMLLGRQYQQLLPMIEKLGTDAEARAEFLNNENAMTAEQVEQNKEIARMQSKMNEEWEALIANLTPVALFLSGFLNNIIAMVQWVAKLGEMWKVFQKKEVAKGAEDMQGREKALRESIKSGTLSKEDAAALKKIQEGGGTIDDFVVDRLKKQKEEDKPGFIRRTVGAVTGFVAEHSLDGSPVQFAAGMVSSAALGESEGREGYIAAAEKDNADHKARATARAKERYDAEEKALAEKYKAEEEARAAAEENEVREARDSFVSQGFEGDALAAKMNEFQGIDAEGKEVAGGFTERKRKEKEALVDSSVKARLEHTNKGPTEEDMEATKTEGASGQARYTVQTGVDAALAQDKFTKELAAKAAKAGKSVAAMAKALGIKGYSAFNSKTGKFEEAKTGAAAVRGEDIDIKFTGEEKLAKKKKDKQERALKRSERGKRVDGTPIEVAEDKLADAQDAKDDADDDYDTAKGVEEKAAAIYKAAKAKREQLMKDRDALKKQQGGKLTDVQEAAFKAEIGAAKTNESSSKVIFEKATDDRGAKQIASNTAGNAVGAAESALAKAKMETWAKERKEQEDLHKDKMDDIRSESEQRYKNMKLEGASEQEIAEARFDDQMKLYEDSVKEQEALQKEIDANRQQRVEEAIMAGDPNAYAKGDMTDAEKAALKGGREKVDAEKNKTVNALYAIDPNAAKSAGVVSDLGKLGGGGAVQFGGNNPVDEIRKSNRWLEIIAKGVTSDKFKDAGTFGALAKYAPVTGGATYGANTPSR